MKKLVIAVIALMVSIGVTYAQGQVNFATKVGSGASATVKAQGLTTSGALVSSPPFLAALQIQGAPNSFTLVPGTTTSFQPNPGGFAGYVLPITATIPGHDVGSAVTLRVVGFVGSSEADYAGALAAGNVGFSIPVDVTLGGGTTAPPNLTGLIGNFTITPEPSTIAFGLLGAAALLIRRRK